MPATNEDGQDHIRPGCNCLPPQEADLETTPKANSELRGSPGIFCKEVWRRKFKIPLLCAEYCFVFFLWYISMVAYSIYFLIGLCKKRLDND